MAKMGIVENGLKKHKRTKRRRRNPLTAAKITKNPARRSISLVSAKSVLKKNGLKAISLKANPHKRRKHRKHRNGVAVVSTRRNGFFGNTKGDAVQVLQLGAGALGVKAVGRALSGVIAPFLSQIGVGNYAEIITDAGLALFVAPFVADKVSRGSGKMVRLGGLLTVGLDIVEMFAPNFMSFNPFNTSPIVMTGSGAAVAPAAVAQLAADVANSPNPQAAAAKVGGVMAQLDAAGAQGQYTSNYTNGASPELVV